MPQFEYLRRIDCTDEEMDELGKLRWECFQITPLIPECISLGFKVFYFKRTLIQ